MTWQRYRDPDEERPAPGAGQDPERAQREAARRAATKIRRFAVRHELDRLGTLTYEHEPADLDEVWRDVEQFRKRMAAELGQRIAIVAVPERGEKNGRLHVHFLYGRFLDKRMVNRCWGKGWIDLRQIKTLSQIEALASRSRTGEPPPPAGPLGKRARCRIAAMYVSAYVKKGFVEHHEFGRNRYSMTRGMQQEPRRGFFQTTYGARAWVVLSMDGNLVAEWSSDEIDGWDCPPVWVGYWGDP